MNVLVTGTSSGLGKVLYLKFKEYSSTSVFGTQPHAGDFLSWDATSEESTIELARNLPLLDVVVHNAGINAIREFENLTEEFILEVMRVNFLGPVMLTRALLEQNKLRVGARICHVTSDAAWRPMRHSLAYNCSKAALDMATKQMARELTKPYDLTIFAIRPGKMEETGMSRYIDEQVRRLRNWTPEQAEAYAAAARVDRRAFWPDEVADVICHFCTTNIPISGACIDLAG